MDDNNNVRDDLKQIGQLGKKVASGLVNKAKSKAREIGKSVQVQSVEQTVALARRLSENLKRVPSEITRRSIRNRYNHLVRGGMSPDEAINFVSEKVKTDLKKEVGN